MIARRSGVDSHVQRAGEEGSTSDGGLPRFDINGRVLHPKGEEGEGVNGRRECRLMKTKQDIRRRRGLKMKRRCTGADALFPDTSLKTTSLFNGLKKYPGFRCWAEKGSSPRKNLEARL